MDGSTIADVLTITDWHSCYEGGWKDAIVPEAFAHPAKFSRSLIVRIIRHGLDQGYWKPGDLIGDCFGGVALGGIIAGYHGLNWIGVELEPRFVELGNQNLAMHGPRWLALGEACCVKLVQGDSRRFAEIVGEVCGVVSSPPFCDAGMGDTRTFGGIKEKKAHWNETTGPGGLTDYGQAPGQIGSLPAGQLDAAITSPPYSEGLGHGGEKKQEVGRGDMAYQSSMYGRYGKADGQIEQLPTGSLDAAITSPPYAESIGNANHIDYSKAQDPNTSHRGSHARDSLGGPYGSTPGQIGALHSGAVDAVVTSPPWEDQEPSHAQGDEEFKTGKRQSGGTRFLDAEYGESDGQIGVAAGETYWQAMRQVYAQMHAAIKPGGYAAIVVKDYVKDKARVPLCDQTCTLLEAVGFVVFERCRCWLVKRDEHPGLFGEAVVKTTERKSFFRRLAEKKGSPRIDYEEVLWCRKPAAQGQLFTAEVEATQARGSTT